MRVTQKELSEKIRVEERRKCRAEIEDLKARNRALLQENINLRTDNAELRRTRQKVISAPDWVMSMFHMYGLM